MWPRLTHPELQGANITDTPDLSTQEHLLGGVLSDIEEDHCTTDRLQSSAEGASGQRDNLNMSDLMAFRDIRERAHVQECQAAKGGAVAAQNTQSLNNSNIETVCTIKQR
ncbi:hypothetical protein ABVT39_027357 [Epinephelus coioides]